MKLDEFKQIVFDISQRLYLKVGQVEKADITPNFHAAEILGEEKPIYVLCNENREWAFSSIYEKYNCKLNYVNYEKFSSLLTEIYKEKVYRVEELNGPFKEKDYLLESDILYWKPVTLGEGVFNWWD